MGKETQVGVQHLLCELSTTIRQSIEKVFYAILCFYPLEDSVNGYKLQLHKT